MKLLWIIGAAAVLLSVGSLIPGPYAKTVKPGNHAGPLLEDAKLSGVSARTLQRACANCHSDQTQWPWYSHIAPVSWLIRKDVHDARELLNFSTWRGYGPAGRSQLLVLAADQIRSGAMPPSRYQLLHPESRLEPEERTQLIADLSTEAAQSSETTTNQPNLKEKIDVINK